MFPVTPHAYGCICDDCLGCTGEDAAYEECEGHDADDADVCPETPRMPARASAHTPAEEVAELRAQLAALRARVEALEKTAYGPDSGNEDPPRILTTPGARRCYSCGKMAMIPGTNPTPQCDKCLRA
jgi:hypothetical protein